MGWYGNYNNSTEVLDEMKRSVRLQGWNVIDTKLTKATGAYIAEKDGKIAIDLFIFEDDMYKPLSAVDRWDFIPSKWKTLYKPFMNDYEKQSVEIDKQYKAEQKVKQKELENFLQSGATYKIWNQHVAEYRYKDRTGYIFSVVGQLTRFKKLNTEDVELINTEVQSAS